MGMFSRLRYRADPASGAALAFALMGARPRPQATMPDRCAGPAVTSHSGRDVARELSRGHPESFLLARGALASAPVHYRNIPPGPRPDPFRSVIGRRTPPKGSNSRIRERGGAAKGSRPHHDREIEGSRLALGDRLEALPEPGRGGASASNRWRLPLGRASRVKHRARACPRPGPVNGTPCPRIPSAVSAR